MAKQTVNTGTSANDRTGDSLRAAFTKINANFTELYTALGLDELPLNLGAFEFTGSTITTTDSSGITIDQATTITSDLTVGGDIVPSVAQGGDLGSLTKPWRSLYVSSSTVYFGGVPLSIDDSGNLLVNGSTVSGGGSTAWNDVTGKPTFAAVATSGSYADLSNKPYLPTDISDLTDTENLLGGSPSSLVNGANTVSLGSDGTLTLPGTGTIRTAFGAMSINAPTGSSNLSIKSSDTTTYMIVGNGSAGVTVGAYNWQFSNTGNLTFPDSTIQTTAWTGNFGYLTADKDAIRGTSGYQYTFATDGYFTSSTSSESTNYFFVAYNTTNANIAAGWTVVGGTANTTVSSVTYPVAGYPGVIRVNLTAAASSTSGFYPVTVTSPDRLRVEIQPNPGTSDKFAFTTSGLTFPDGSLALTDSILNNGLDADLKGSVFADDSTIMVDAVSNKIYTSELTFSDGTTTVGKTIVVPEDEDFNITLQHDFSDGAGPLPFSFSVSWDRITLLNGNGKIITGSTAGNNEWALDASNKNLSFPNNDLILYNGSLAGEGLDYGLRLFTYTKPVIVTSGQTRSWTFGTDGNLTLPGDIRSEREINIDINLSDSTTHTWRFGEDGNLEAPGIVSAAGLRTSESLIALGNGSGTTNQGNFSVAIGTDAGYINQGAFSVALGTNAGKTDQSAFGIAIGANAGQTSQNTFTVAIGANAGQTSQGSNTVAIGVNAGQDSQGMSAIGIGVNAGNDTQGSFAIAIGVNAGQLNQGADAIAIGRNAATTNQAANSIVINATSSTVENTTVDSFVVKPVRSAAGTSILQYDSSTGEITHTNEIYSDQQISITVSGEDSTQKTWYFGNDGDLAFPDGTNYAGQTVTMPTTPNGVTNSFVWEFSDQVIGNDRITLNWNLLASNTDSFYLGTTHSTTGKYLILEGSSQSLSYISNGVSSNSKIIFGAPAGNNAGDANAIELKAADGDVYLTSTESVKITVDANDSSARVWTFDPTGVLSLPEGGDIVDSTGASVLGGGGGGSVLEEPFESKTSATGVIEHDATTNRLFYHTSITANFTANFTNLGLAANEATSISLVLVQGATARMVTAVQIGGAAQTITWQGSASAPSGNANRTDVVTFSILCTATDTYTVLGMLTSFGG